MATMTKEQVQEQVKKAMSNNLICNGEQAEEAINFVLELLEVSIDETKANEPYATRSIKEMQDAYSRVRDLQDLIENIE